MILFLLLLCLTEIATQQYQVVLELFGCIEGQGLEQIDHTPVFR